METVQARLLLRLYIAGLCVLAVAAAVLVAAVDRGLDRWWLGVAAAALIAVDHVFATQVRREGRQRESFSHEEAYVVVLALVASPLVAVSAFAAGFLVGNVVARREPIKVAFNVAAMTFQASVAVLIVNMLRGSDDAGPRTAAAAVVGGVVFYLLNWVLIAEVFTLADVGTLRSNLLDDVGGRTFVAAADIAIGVLAGLAAVTSIWTLPFSIVALAALHYTLSGHAVARGERQKLGDIVSSSSDGIVSVGRDDRVVAWNPASERLTGYRAEEVVGKRFDQVSALLQAERTDAAGVSFVPTDSIGELYDVQIRRADGSDRWLAVTRAPTPDGGAVIVLRDETRRRELEGLRAQEESERLRADLVAAVSHELRTPLTSMIGFTQTLLSRELDRAETRRYLQIIREQGRRLGQLIDDLLDLRLVGAETRDEFHEPIDLREVLEEQVRELGPNAPKHSARRSRTAASGRACATRDSGSRPSSSRTSSSGSSASAVPSAARSGAQVLASRCLGRSSVRTAARSGSRASKAKARRSSSSCRSRVRATRRALTSRRRRSERSAGRRGSWRSRRPHGPVGCTNPVSCRQSVFVDQSAEAVSRVTALGRAELASRSVGRSWSGGVRFSARCGRWPL